MAESKGKAIGRPKVKDWAALNVSVDYPLLKAFRKACQERGHTLTWVIENAMRYYVEHPQANGWAVPKPEKKRVRTSKESGVKSSA